MIESDSIKSFIIDFKMFDYCKNLQVLLQYSTTTSVTSTATCAIKTANTMAYSTTTPTTKIEGSSAKTT